MPAHRERRNHEDLAIVQADDGWADAAAENAERVIKGTLLKFGEWRWTKGKESTEVEAGTALIALGTAAGWVKWYGGKPIEYLMREPGKQVARSRRTQRSRRLRDLGDRARRQAQGSLAEHALCLLRRPGQCRSIHVRPPRPGVGVKLSTILPSKSSGYVTENRARRLSWNFTPSLG